MSKAAYDSLRCSFCHKSQDVVGKLIASAHVYHTERAYICDECIPICVAILEDDRTEGSEPASLPPPQIKNPLLLHPLAPQLLAAVEAWVRAEDLGIIGAQTDLMEVRQIGRIMFGLTAE